MGDQLEFVDDNADVRLAGSLLDPGAAEGDVLTVGADGSVAAAAVAPVPSITFAAFQGGLAIPAPFDAASPQFKQVMAFDPEATGIIAQVQTVPPFTYAAGVIATFTVYGVSHVDTTADAYDIALGLFVSDTTGANQLALSGSAQANGGTANDSATILFGDLSGTPVGVDLSYDDASGEISSVAGGVYSIVIIYSGQRD